MTIPNPLVITVNGSAKNLDRINQDGYSSHYRLRESAQQFDVKIRHSNGKTMKNGKVSERHNVELTRTVFAAGAVPEYSYVSSVTITNDDLVSSADMGYLQTALNGLLTAGIVSDLRAWVN